MAPTWTAAFVILLALAAVGAGAAVAVGACTVVTSSVAKLVGANAVALSRRAAADTVVPLQGCHAASAAAATSCATLALPAGLVNRFDRQHTMRPAPLLRQRQRRR
eukprot:2141042-Pleurochrysis_carterae.AAC.1